MGKILNEGWLYWKSHNVPLKIPWDFYELIQSYAIPKNWNEAKNRACGCDSGFRITPLKGIEQINHKYQGMPANGKWYSYMSHKLNSVRHGIAFIYVLPEIWAMKYKRLTGMSLVSKISSGTCLADNSFLMAWRILWMTSLLNSTSGTILRNRITLSSLYWLRWGTHRLSWISLKSSTGVKINGNFKINWQS